MFLQATEVKTSEIDFNSEFITSMVSRIDYTALKKAVEMVCITFLKNFQWF